MKEFTANGLEYVDDTNFGDLSTGEFTFMQEYHHYCNLGCQKDGCTTSYRSLPARHDMRDVEALYMCIADVRE